MSYTPAGMFRKKGAGPVGRQLSGYKGWPAQYRRLKYCLYYTNYLSIFDIVAISTTISINDLSNPEEQNIRDPWHGAGPYLLVFISSLT